MESDAFSVPPQFQQIDLLVNQGVFWQSESCLHVRGAKLRGVGVGRCCASAEVQEMPRLEQLLLNMRESRSG
jgi:hypothetical protein